MKDYIKRMQQNPCGFMIAMVVLMVFLCGNNSKATSVYANLTSDQASATSSGMSQPLNFQGGVLICKNSCKLIIEQKKSYQITYTEWKKYTCKPNTTLSPTQVSGTQNTTTYRVYLTGYTADKDAKAKECIAWGKLWD